MFCNRIAPSAALARIPEFFRWRFKKGKTVLLRNPRWNQLLASDLLRLHGGSGGEEGRGGFVVEDAAEAGGDELLIGGAQCVRDAVDLNAEIV